MNEIEFTHCLKDSCIDVDVTADVDYRTEDVVLKSVLVTAMAKDPTDIVKLLSAGLRAELAAAALVADDHMWRMGRAS